MMKNNIPEIGKTYAFFDDGKTGPSRRYKATITGIIPFHLVKEKFPDLYYRWKSEVTTAAYLYAMETDYFVECSIPRYENIDDFVYFVRDVNSDWFSIDFPHNWMGGLLDVDGEYSKKNDVPPVDEWVGGKDYLEYNRL